jgi:hypothetical protein
MARFLLHHQHTPVECGAAFAAWKGFVSPLRSRQTLSTCLTGGHALWWCVIAADAPEALAMLPRYVAERTDAIEARTVSIP